jgi:hypothetical protein
MVVVVTSGFSIWAARDVSSSSTCDAAIADQNGWRRTRPVICLTA